MSLHDIIRKRLDDMQILIDNLNTQKSGWVSAWEGEKKRQNDPELEKPEELRKLNKQLFGLYTQRDEVLEEYPIFKLEYGGGKKRNTVGGKSPLSESSKGSSREVKEAKKRRHLANLEARRMLDRARTEKSKKGGR